MDASSAHYTPTEIRQNGAKQLAIAWTDGGRGLLVRAQGELPSRVYRLDVGTGRRELWKELMPSDPAGVLEILGVLCTPDTRFYAYTYARALTELYLVEGLE